MKQSILILLATFPILSAGTPEPVMTLPPSQGDWIKPLIDIRARYEFADIEGKDQSNAFTIRERLGLQTMDWNGFSVLVEGRVGRQRIIYDNAAFIGNVGWRQNEQTFDAISISGKWIDSLAVNYAYIDQVNRIFGSDAAGKGSSVDSEVHALNLSYTGIEGIKLGGYAYIMEFADLPVWDNRTYGVSAAGKLAGLDLYGEVAWQEDAGAAGNSDAFYFHAKATKSLFEKQSLIVGIESLDAGFKTPLATIHAFNGFSDAFLGGRASGGHNGLTDTYVSHSMPLCWGLKWINVLHAFGNNEISSGYGWEYDSVLVKKFDVNFTAIAKFAYFESRGDPFVGAGTLSDTTRFSIERNGKF
ncbi:MAG: hypothetical protein OSA84_06560 [Akkermansiaceae bacterium]|nr:hypothetical protein [Akkermansiaceae bacterium]